MAVIIIIEVFIVSIVGVDVMVIIFVVDGIVQVPWLVL